MRIQLALITIILIASVFFLVIFPDSNNSSVAEKLRNSESSVSSSK